MLKRPAPLLHPRSRKRKRLGRWESGQHMYSTHCSPPCDVQHRLRLEPHEGGCPASKEDHWAVGFDALGNGAHDAQLGICSSGILDAALDDVDGRDGRCSKRSSTKRRR